MLKVETLCAGGLKQSASTVGACSNSAAFSSIAVELPPMAKESRQGMVPEGWTKQGVIVPDPVWAALRKIGEERGHGSMKVVGTCGFALIAGMPEHVRDRLAKHMLQLAYDGPDKVTPQAMWTEFVRLLSNDFGNARVVSALENASPGDLPLPNPDTHEVVRILDPSVTLPRGIRVTEEAKREADEKRRAKGGAA